jgi:hypothetical protein
MLDICGRSVQKMVWLYKGNVLDLCQQEVRTIRNKERRNFQAPAMRLGAIGNALRRGLVKLSAPSTSQRNEAPQSEVK